ncbi:hypothetical protein [Dictyobacter aurantiacus]|uniref:Uncharacterized protein n=1 Tax=Dictyobacter aurantiacus TaxID=1936993 RepID=A0A401Z8R6_9CHLR|nr:hypothetical protein [Dictyobacter aurantiacus]GCE03208.1 hypothetical protein KDAU_05370 [Dictyobacter aurantiacus]
MDAIVGRYRAHMEESGLVLKHPSGISFDLTPEEALGLLDFITAYRPTLLALQEERDTDPRMASIVLDKDTRNPGLEAIAPSDSE